MLKSNGKLARKTQISAMDYIYLFPLILYITVLVFEGPLRYYLWHENIETLVYLPKGLMFFLFWFAIVIDLANHRVNKVFLFLLGVTAFAFFVGWHNTGRFYQAAFGVWVYIPFLYSALILKSFLRLETRGRLSVIALLLISLTGIWWDFFRPFPWTGFVYELGQAVIEASREWTTFGIDRCAGFSRASYSAAYLILFFSIYLTCTMRNRFLITLIWIGCAPALLATTHKTAIAIYIFLTILIPFIRFFPRTQTVEYCIKYIPSVCALVGIFIPFLSGIISVNPNSYTEEVIFSSIGMRLTDTWPEAISFIANQGNLIFGRGIGSIGVSQIYFEPEYYNSADNMYITLYANFGIGMFLFVGIWVWGLAKLNIRGRWQDRLFWLFGLVILTKGWTVNGIDDPLTTVAMGLCFSYVLQRKRFSATAKQSPIPLTPCFIEKLESSQSLISLAFQGRPASHRPDRTGRPQEHPGAGQRFR